MAANKIRALVRYNREAAQACRRLKDFESAEKFINVAREKISDRIAASEVAEILFTAAQIDFDREKFADALPLALAAVEKSSSIAPKKFDRLTEQLIFLGNVYTKIGDHQSALDSFNRAIQCQRENPHPENALTELATCSAAESLMRLQNFDEAEKILQELLTKQRISLYETQPRIEAVKQLLRLCREKKSPSE